MKLHNIISRKTIWALDTAILLLELDAQDQEADGRKLTAISRIADAKELERLKAELVAEYIISGK